MVRANSRSTVRPRDVSELVTAYGRWVRNSRVPKLFVNGDPGSILVGAQREYCRSFPNQTELTVKGIHFLQEDSADEIATAIGSWFSPPN